MFRRHFFLFAALAVVALMVVAGGWRLATARDEAAGPGGGPPGAAGGRGGAGGGPGGRATPVSATTIAPKPFSDRIEALGEAKARQSVVITSTTTEQITRVLFTSGQSVRAGQTLVQLEAGEQAAGALQAQASLRQAQRDYARQKTLFDKGFVARARLDDAQAAVDVARAALGAEQARQGDRVIRAPFSGVIGLTDAAPGQLIAPGTPIATLDDLTVIRVDFEVPERHLSALREGQGIEATAEAFGTEPVRGRIARIDTRVDPATRAITARAEFANPGGRIKPGMLMRVAIERGSRQAPAAPEAAVQFEGDAAYVFKIVSQGERTVAQRADVRVGGRAGGFVEILDGARSGERIIADGVNRVQPNQPVTVAGAVAGRAGAAPPPAGQGRPS